MNKKRVLLVAFLSVFLGFTKSMVKAEDPLKVAPEMYNLVFENERVRVMQVTFAPGQKIPRHSHPEHYVYVLDAGTLRVSKPDGTSSDATVGAGQVLWFPAETHWAENTGTTQVRLLVNELKEPRPVKKKK